MYKSIDNGKTWTSIKGDSPISVIQGIASSDSFLFVFNNDTIYRSEEEGNTQQLANSGLPTDPRIWHLTGSRNGYLAASSTRNVYFSRKNGSSWMDISGGLSLAGPGFIDWILIVYLQLFAATDEEIWRFNLSPLVSVEESEQENVPNNFTLMQY